MSKIPNYFFAQKLPTEEYYIEEKFIPGWSFDSRYENRLGKILIGGDKGDLIIDYAYNEGDGVRLHGIKLQTGFTGLSDEGKEGMIDEILWDSYNSIGGDSFMPNKRLV